MASFRRSVSCLSQKASRNSPEEIALVERPTINGHVKLSESDQFGSVGFVDFWPLTVKKAVKASCATFEQFEVLVERANEWLEENDDFELINCESLDKKVIYVADVYSQSLIYADEDANTHAVHIIGLRYALTEEKSLILVY
ncbi:DgyrCDS9194 [Dimorphilus gyrociliatus]|uniref:DgyrCDS9194 n=1 Tax=Dimorphilus gyrociliatus TaxID=2664684 RepID=A0A7I8VWN7_9ANNE|nr:DgyrCDS9194 [Dimorphilus gyrociliatus]